MMDTLVTIGILLDVSKSIRRSFIDIPEEGLGDWTESMFEVVVAMVNHDVSPENKIFALAVGASGDKPIFDILATMKKFKSTNVVLKNPKTEATDDHIKEVIQLLKKNGLRHNVSKEERDVLKSNISDYMICLVMSEFKNNAKFKDYVIKNILPDLNENFSWFKLALRRLGIRRIDISEDFRAALDKIKAALLESPNEETSVIGIHEALKILEDCINSKKISISRGKKFFKFAKPFIYGEKSLLEGLNVSKELLESVKEREGMKRILLLVSDGKTDDIETYNRRTVENVKSKLKEQNIAVVCCFISEEKFTTPRKLYNSIDSSWSEGAQFLFTLSSKVPDTFLPRALLLKQGWDIDISDHQTKLFIQASHPDNIREACDIARNVVCTQEGLSDLLASVSLEIYINQSNSTIRAPEQEGGTCYANASATVLHLSMKRVLGRDDYPDFHSLRQELIERYGTDGANTYQVLHDICPKYRLHCRIVDDAGALRAITEKRLVVSTFFLTEEEWRAFGKFFEHNPMGVISNDVIDISRRPINPKLEGHAVVLTSFNSQFLRFMNSWGENWGDMGFFRVKTSKVLDMELIDVFWTLNDLNDKEKQYYEEHGSHVSKRLMDSFIGLQKQQYTCEVCEKPSPVIAYTGTLHRARCPLCKNEFSCSEAGNILALNMYLLSLTR